MAYEVVMPYHLHMPSYFLETFTEYPFLGTETQPCLNYIIQSTPPVLLRCLIKASLKTMPEITRRIKSNLIGYLIYL